MSEAPKSRDVSEIQVDYQNLCLKAGHIQYQIFALSKDLELVNSSLRDLNLEAANVKSQSESVEPPKAVEQVEAAPSSKPEKQSKSGKQSKSSQVVEQS